jgi:5'-nucleotidase
MRILICNDDGIDAPGIALAEQAARLLTDDVWVVAPDAKRTAAASSLTLGQKLTMHKLGPSRFSCSGTPADCVVTAMTWLFKDQKLPDLVISGVNDGLNIAEDIAYSGTLGIAREAAFWGLPAIAISREKAPTLSSGDAAFLGGLIEQMWSVRAEWQAEGHWLSLNLSSALHAPVAQPGIGRDKIARSSEVVFSEEDRTDLIVPRGRAGSSKADDENSYISKGFCTVNRLNWFGESRLNTKLVQDFSAGHRV